MADVITPLLQPDEQITYRARHNWLFNLKSGFLLNRFHLIVVTNKRIIEKRGLLATHIQSIPFSQIESSDLTHTLAGRLLGYGDVIIQGSGQTVIHLRHLAHPARLIGAINATPKRRTADKRPQKRIRKQPRGKA